MSENKTILTEEEKEDLRKFRVFLSSNVNINPHEVLHLETEQNIEEWIESLLAKKIEEQNSKIRFDLEGIDNDFIEKSTDEDDVVYIKFAWELRDRLYHLISKYNTNKVN